jgi:hypothetical protein
MQFSIISTLVGLLAIANAAPNALPEAFPEVDIKFSSEVAIRTTAANINETEGKQYFNIS